MRSKEAAPVNKFIFDHISSLGVNTSKEIAQETGVSHTTLSYVRTGKYVITPDILLKMLQRFPPRNFAELGRMGDVWLPRYRKQKEEEMKSNALRSRTEAAPRNKEFFDFLEQHGLTDAAAARILEVSKSYMSHLRVGRDNLSDRGMQIARAKIIDALMDR